mgnify:CR=1 FL=1
MKNAVKITKALGDQNRMRVVLSLISFGKLCVCQISKLLNISAPSVSTHMKILKEAEIVSARKSGKWVFFSIAEQFPSELLSWLKNGVLNSAEASKDRDFLKKVLCCEEDCNNNI